MTETSRPVNRTSAHSFREGYVIAPSNGDLRFLLIRPLMTDPVAALVRIRIFAPGLRLHQPLRTGDHLELPVRQDLTDEYRSIGVVIGGIHHDLAARRQELAAIDRLSDLVDFTRPGLLHSLLPDIHTEVGGFDRIVRDALIAIRQVVLLPVG